MSILDKNNEQLKNEYEAFVISHKNGSFMQSLMWPEVKKGWEWEAVYIKAKDGTIKGTALVLIRKIPFVKFNMMYVPRGPVCDFDDTDTLKKICDEIDKLAKKYNAYECITDPYITVKDEKAVKLLQESGFICDLNLKDEQTVQVKDNYMLFIGGRSKDELFENSTSKCRYNTRLAIRKGVTCRIGTTDEDLDEFVKLMKITGKRDGFVTREKEYFKGMLDTLGEHCRLYLCECEGKTVSGAITTNYGGKACYVYGASSNEYRNYMPNNLMQWTMIEWAVKTGCYVYDFQGIPHYKDENHPNFGMYRFKRSFNGEIVSFLGEFTHVYSKRKKKIVSFMEKCNNILLEIKK